MKLEDVETLWDSLYADETGGLRADVSYSDERGVKALWWATRHHEQIEHCWPFVSASLITSISFRYALDPASVLRAWFFYVIHSGHFGELDAGWVVMQMARRFDRNLKKWFATGGFNANTLLARWVADLRPCLQGVADAHEIASRRRAAWERRKKKERQEAFLEWHYQRQVEAGLAPPLEELAQWSPLTGVT